MTAYHRSKQLKKDVNKTEITLQIFRLFLYSYPSSSLRCSLVASARLCCLSRVPPAVCPSLLESATTVCTFFLQSLLRTYIRRRLIPYYDSGPLHKHQIFVRPIFHQWESRYSGSVNSEHPHTYCVSKISCHAIATRYSGSTPRYRDHSSNSGCPGRNSGSHISPITKPTNLFMETRNNVCARMGGQRSPATQDLPDRGPQPPPVQAPCHARPESYAVLTT